MADAPFQDRVRPWMMACFGPEISGDRVERADRLLEEVFELLQSGGYDPARVLSLRDYVWGREIGEPAQEVGGVMVTLAAYCLAHDLDMHQAGETELARIWTKVEKIRAKQAAKPKHSPLPVASSPSPAYAEAVPVALIYTNYKGETATRTITPRSFWFGSTEWHPEPQYLLRAFDHDKQAERDFALTDFGFPSPAYAGEPGTGAIMPEEPTEAMLRVLFTLNAVPRNRDEVIAAYELLRNLVTLVPATSQAEGGAEVKGWRMVPTIGACVKAAHPITPLNPSETFIVLEVKMDDRGEFFARGEETMWFNTRMLSADLRSSSPVGKETAKEGGALAGNAAERTCQHGIRWPWACNDCDEIQIATAVGHANG